MRNIKYYYLVIMCAFLSSCTFHHYALIPPPGNTSWTPEKNSAIILVGLTSDEAINEVWVADDIEGIPLASLLFKPNKHNTLAIHFRTGEKFRLTGISYSKASISTSRYMSFKDLPVLEIEKPGIYYYGNIYSKKGKGGFSSAANKDTIRNAKEVYPKVFSELKPINF